MKAFVARNWWMFLLRGLAAILFGIVAFLYPGLTLAAFVIVYGAFALVDGVAALFSLASKESATQHRWTIALQGLIGVAIGVITLRAPGITAIGLLIAIAAWALSVGVLQLVAAIRLRDEIEGELLLGLSGVLSILFALYLVARPGEGALALAWGIGLYGVLQGIALVAFAIKARRLA